MESMENPGLIKVSIQGSFKLGRGLALAVGLALLLATSSLSAQNTASTENPNFGLIKMQGQVLGARPLGMFYYSPDTRGIESLKAHAVQMTVFAPQSFWVDHDGFVHGEIPPQVLDVARGANVPIMPLVYNPGFDRPTVSALLRNTKAQERAASYLAYLAQRDNYLGWQIDFENLAPADKQRYTRFVERVAARLRRDKRLVSVAVPPRFSDKFPDRKRGKEFRTTEWASPFDYRGLGRAADFITIMTYDHHGEDGPPGPVAGYDWVKAALDYAVLRIPPGKLLLGIPFYGREWTQNGKTSSHSLTFPDAQAQAARPGVEAHWDPRWRTAWYQYRDAGGVHTGWYEDRKSLTEKLEMMQKYRLRGFAAWRLGQEDPGFWSLGIFAPEGQPASAQRAGPPTGQPSSSLAPAKPPL